MSQPHAPHAAAFDPLDPHHEGEGHGHGHVIVSGTMLKLVLTILLVFTVLTVAASQGEKWIAATFDVVIPQWVNVVVAMSIAVVKSVFVAMYFMQLRYDKGLNTIIFLFCLFAFTLFLGFAMGDLHSRDAIDPLKSGTIVRGGTGGLQRGSGDAREDITIPITQHVRAKYMARWGPEEFARREAIAHGGHADHHGPNEDLSTASRSRPRVGPTPGLFDEGDHAAPHGPASAPAHAPAGGH